jgi:uncharacterized protein
MAIFVVQYTYRAEPEAIEAIRPSHRSWFKELFEQGILLASGPMVDNPQALLIFNSESVEELSNLLDHDPFDLAGLIETRTIQAWNPVFGPFS